MSERLAAVENKIEYLPNNVSHLIENHTRRLETVEQSLQTSEAALEKLVKSLESASKTAEANEAQIELLDNAIEAIEESIEDVDARMRQLGNLKDVGTRIADLKDVEERFGVLAEKTEKSVAAAEQAMKAAEQAIIASRNVAEQGAENAAAIENLALDLKSKTTQVTTVQFEINADTERLGDDGETLSFLVFAPQHHDVGVREQITTELRLLPNISSQFGSIACTARRKDEQHVAVHIRTRRGSLLEFIEGGHSLDGELTITAKW